MRRRRLFLVEAILVVAIGAVAIAEIREASERNPSHPFRFLLGRRPAAVEVNEFERRTLYKFNGDEGSLQRAANAELSAAGWTRVNMVSGKWSQGPTREITIGRRPDRLITVQISEVRDPGWWWRFKNAVGLLPLIPPSSPRRP